MFFHRMPCIGLGILGDKDGAQMLAVYQLAVPTPYNVGPVNVYLIKNDPLTLIDVGPATPEARRFLQESLRHLGVDLKDIKRIVITHAHPDHCGLLPELTRLTGAAVYMHHDEGQKVRGGYEQYMALLPHLLETGIPREAINGIMNNRGKTVRSQQHNVEYVGLQNDDKIDFDAGTLTVMHLPGHSPGHICLYDPVQKHFFSGDFLLSQITPNPIMEPDPVNPGRRLPTLKQYLTSLDVVEDLAISMVCPGHGGVFSDYQGVINNGRCHHQLQFQQIMKQLEGQELNTFQISQRIYPGLQGWEIFLGLSEIQAHLDFLTAGNKIDACIKQGVAYYTL